jgi:DNA polymerase-4
MYSIKVAPTFSLSTLFVDFNAYFASVEQQSRPELRGRPVGVVPVMTDSTCCIAASYEAKAFGIKTGTSVREARLRCPGIVIVEARPPLYVEFHQRAVALVDSVAPVRQVMSIDEMECELTGRWRERERALTLARQIKSVLRSQLGEYMGVSIGIAPNTFLGKLASDLKKPNGLTVIESTDIPHRLLEVPLSAYNGIGPRMLRRLERSGINTTAQLYAAPRDLLHSIWGGVAGLEMYDKLRGQPYAPRTSPQRSIGHSHVLPPDLRNPQSAYSVLDRLMQKAAMRLRKQQLYASALSVHVRTKPPGAEHHQHADDHTRFSQTQDTVFLLHTLHTLWHRGLHLIAQPKAVGIVLHELVPAHLHTPSLFDESPAPTSASTQRTTQARQPPAQLLKALDQLNQKYGKNTLYFASSHHSREHAPMRIAFTRIPDVGTEG